ncbi:hypothetical protein BpHYR1_034937, partial [Brachionus plicatilis]
VADLKQKCKDHEISYQGTKAEVIKRLNKYVTENGLAGEQNQVNEDIGKEFDFNQYIK